MRIAVVQHRLGITQSEDMSALVGVADRAVAAGAEWVVLPEVPSLATSPGRFLAASQPPASVGEVIELLGDECVDASTLAAVGLTGPSVLVLRPRSENDLQSEAFLELAIALSDSVAGLVIIAECIGAEQGDPGHGGSAIIALGDVVAEALAGDEVIYADVTLPITPPEPPEPLPVVPSLLRQRAAFHSGLKLEVSEYPSDIS